MTTIGALAAAWGAGIVALVNSGHVAAFLLGVAVTLAVEHGRTGRALGRLETLLETIRRLQAGQSRRPG